MPLRADNCDRYAGRRNFTHLCAGAARIDLPIETFAETLPAPAGPDPTDEADALRVIEQFDDRSARIVMAIGLEGLSVAEVGALMGMTETAFRVRLHRAMERLAALRERMIHGDR